MFQNPEIAIDDLPDCGNVSWLALHARYRSMIQLEIGVLFLFFAIVMGVAQFFARPPLAVSVIFWLLWALLTSTLLYWPRLAIPRRGYVARDKDILFRKGIIWRSVTAVPFNRIQHVETSSTPLDRKFGLATLQLFTAGGSGGDLKIYGLGADTAEQLRVFILQRAGASVENN